MSESKTEQSEFGFFPKEEPLPEVDEKLIDIYQRHGVPLDHLLIFGGIGAIVEEARKSGDKRTKEDLVKRLMNLRKAGRLPRLAFKRAASQRVSLRLQTLDDLPNHVYQLASQGITSMSINVEGDGGVELIYESPVKDAELS